MIYSFSIYRVENEGDFAWVAESKELKNCLGVGDTQEEAIAELAENEVAWLEMAESNGQSIPCISIEKPSMWSGKFTLRMSPKEHEHATNQADKQGVSLNQYINDAVVAYSAGNALTNAVSLQLNQLLVLARENPSVHYHINVKGQEYRPIDNATFLYDNSNRYDNWTSKETIHAN